MRMASGIIGLCKKEKTLLTSRLEGDASQLDELLIILAQVFDVSPDLVRLGEEHKRRQREELKRRSGDDLDTRPTKVAYKAAGLDDKEKQMECPSAYGVDALSPVSTIGSITTLSNASAQTDACESVKPLRAQSDPPHLVVSPTGPKATGAVDTNNPSSPKENSNGHSPVDPRQKACASAPLTPIVPNKPHQAAQVMHSNAITQTPSSQSKHPVKIHLQSIPENNDSDDGKRSNPLASRFVSVQSPISSSYSYEPYNSLCSPCPTPQSTWDAEEVKREPRRNSVSGKSGCYVPRNTTRINTPGFPPRPANSHSWSTNSAPGSRK